MVFEVRYNFTGMRSHYANYYETREEALEKVEALKERHKDFKEEAKTLSKAAYRYSRGYYELKEITLVTRKTLVLYNPQPEGKTAIGDCTRRALTKILDIPYSEVKAMQTSAARGKGLGYNTVPVLEKLMKQLGFTYHTYDKPIDIYEAIATIPYKRVIINQDHETKNEGHWVAMIDKKLYDTGSQAYRMPVVGYYYKEEDQQ